MEIKDRCICCNKEFNIADLHELPEVEEYERKLTRATLHGTPPPALVDEGKIWEKYGYGPSSLFCQQCLERIMNQT